MKKVKNSSANTPQDQKAPSQTLDRPRLVMWRQDIAILAYFPMQLEW